MGAGPAMTGNPFSAAPRFPAIDDEQWREAAIASLKGGRFEERLVSHTYDGIDIAPLYTARTAASAVSAAGPAGAAPFIRGWEATPRPWRLAQRVDLNDPTAANAQALDDLEGGANALIIATDINGVAVSNAADIETLLAGVRLDLISVTLEADHPQTVDLFVDLMQRRGHALSSLDFCPGFCPLAAMARGQDIGDEAAFAARLAALHQNYQAMGHLGPLFLLDGRVVADALGSEGQEIASILAQAVDMFRAGEKAGLDQQEVAARLAAKITVDADQFLSIAKLRALRLVWTHLMDAIGLGAAPLDIRAETSWRMLSGRDPWVNVLRGTIACFAGAVGGASEITLHPFTSALGRPDGLARRIARNTQAILAEESSLDRVADPAGGSYYVESLTQALAGKAWTIFQDIEKAGGFATSLRSGWLQQQVGQVRKKRLQALATRRDKITGVSEFPDIHEAPVPVAAPWPQGVAAGGGITPLPRLRLAQAFEDLRQNAEGMQPRPVMFLATLGTPAETITRAGFAKNFFEAGGIGSPGNDGFADIAALTTAFAKSGAALACLCSSDEVYGKQGATAAQALKAAGARLVLLAGNPREKREELTAAGIDSFIYAGMDIVAALTDLQRQIGL